jgi:hypothetical protein
MDPAPDQSATLVDRFHIPTQIDFDMETVTNVQTLIYTEVIRELRYPGLQIRRKIIATLALNGGLYYKYYSIC